MFKLHKSAAFSLIELLVSIVIIMLLVSGALVGYTSYTEKQRLVAVAEKIESGFREAQSRAKVGYLGTCAELRYVNFSVYYYSGTGNGLYHQISLNCAEHAVGYYRSENTFYFRVSEGDEFTIDSPFYDLRFYPYENLNKAVSFTISSTRTTSTATFDIDQGGSIKVTYN